MNKHIYIIAVLLFSCVPSQKLGAQETYWVEQNGKFSSSCGGESCFAIYRTNLMQPDSLFQETRFNDLIVKIESDRFRLQFDAVGDISYQFSEDRQQLYFASGNGKLFRYGIEDDTLEFLIDLVPDGLVGYYTLRNLVWSDNYSTLYFGGEVYGSYNVNTGEHTIFPKNYFVEENWGLIAVSMVEYKGRYIFTSEKATLMELDIENPDNSKLLYDYSVLTNEWPPNILSYQLDCDSIVLCMGIDVDVALPPPWYVVDIDNNRYSFEDLILLEEMGVTFLTQGLFGNPIVNYYVDCRLIDLDMDNSTAEGYDFWIEVPCYNSAIPISDSDMDIKNLKPLDSITVTIKNAISGQYRRVTRQL